MKEEVKIIVIGGGAAAGMTDAILAACTRDVVVVADNDNECSDLDISELLANYNEDRLIPLHIHPVREINMDIILQPDSSNFIQQKMQGKRRVY